MNFLVRPLLQVGRNIVGFVFIAMASLQTNAVLSSPNAANAAMKANTQAAGRDKDDFAAMLNGTASRSSEPKPVAKTEAPQKPTASKSAAAQPHVKARRDAKADNKTENKPDRKSAAKASDAAEAKADKPVVTAKAQPAADATDADGDADNNADAGTQTAANPDNTDPAATQTGAQTSQPPLPQLPQADASAQAQQMLAAAPAAGGQALSATKAANDNNNISGATPPAKGNAAPALPTPTTQDSAPAPDASATSAKTASGKAQDFLKAAGHQDGKTQTADAAKTDASQPTSLSGAAPQPTAPAPQPVAQPAPAIMAANAAGTPASASVANTMGASANAGAATSLHVAPQGPTPNVNSLAVEIAARSQSGSKEFQIRLDPPELGHVEVRLSIDASGKAEAHMTFR